MGAEKVSAAVGYSGSGTALFFGLSPGEWQAIGVMGGLLIALAGFLVNAYFGWRRLKMDQQKREQA